MSGFKKTEKQSEATKLHASHYHVMLYGGSRSGKTFINTRNVIFRATKVKSRHLIARFRFNHVKQSIVYDTLPDVLNICFPDLSCRLNKSDWFLELPNGSEVWFGGLDDSERVDKILGTEYSTIFFNECTQISWDAHNTVMSRLAENSGLDLKSYYDCNPNSRKHWTYTVFKDGKTPDGQVIHNYDDYANLQMNPTDNLDNLPDKYIEILNSLPLRQRKRFLEGEFQDDIEGALWNALMIEKAKCNTDREIKKTIVSVDPAVTNDANSDETGIIVQGLDVMNDGVVIADYSCKASPNEWANRAVNAYREHECAYIVAEVNQGGDMVETIIKSIDPNIKVVKVRASKGKFSRAEPVAALYEQGKIKHLDGLGELENQMCEYVPMNSRKSPDRLDAMVHGFHDLMIKENKGWFMV